LGITILLILGTLLFYKPIQFIIEDQDDINPSELSTPDFIEFVIQDAEKFGHKKVLGILEVAKLTILAKKEIELNQYLLQFTNDHLLPPKDPVILSFEDHFKKK
jgi:hypothetical protein